jgi:PAS domain-containing protein
LSFDSLADGWAKALSVDRKHFNMFFERMMDGFAYHKIVVDKSGKPVDYVFLEVNHTFEKMTGLKREKIIGKKVTEVLKGIENDPADWIGRYGKVALTCESAQFENFAEPLGKWSTFPLIAPKKGTLSHFSKI